MTCTYHAIFVEIHIHSTHSFAPSVKRTHEKPTDRLDELRSRKVKIPPQKIESFFVPSILLALHGISMTAATTSSSVYYSECSSGSGGPLHSCHRNGGPHIIPECASSTYYEIEEAGIPARPLDFPTPTVLHARWVQSRAIDHRNNKAYNNILILERRDGERAYLVKKKISKTVYGTVELCVVLRRRRTTGVPLSKMEEFAEEDVPWISTDEFVAIKASSWTKMRQLRGKHLEDPLKGKIYFWLGCCLPIFVCVCLTYHGPLFCRSGMFTTFRKLSSKHPWLS